MAAPDTLFNEIHYPLVRKIASGGMGVVYEALQLGVDEFSKTVAIKLIREEFSAIKEFRDNFVGEARLVADLIHTNIVQTYHLGTIKGQYFMVMEYVNGVNLEEFIFQHRCLGRPIPIEIAVFIISRICRGLAYAHDKRDTNGRLLGIVHRDVNPKNIMLAQEGDVKLTDFGIAKAFDLMYNEEGEVIAGKDEYLSPEQAERQITDARADLFCCGIVMAELLLDRNIFEADEGSETRKNILEMEIPDFTELRPGIDERLNESVTPGTRQATTCSQHWKSTCTATATVPLMKSWQTISRMCSPTVWPLNRIPGWQVAPPSFFKTISDRSVRTFP